MLSWRTLLAVFAVPLLFAWSCANSTPALTCTGAQIQCGEICTSTASDPDNCGACGSSCPLGEVCSAGKCATECPSGNDVCTPDGGTRGYCVDTRSDNQNCGKCGTKCPGAQVCVNGTCSSSCSSPETTCMPDGGGAVYCANLKTDNQNCGACGFPCPAGEMCSAGACVGACTSSQTMCDGGTVYCADLQTDNANCGSCGMTCGTLQFCSGGTCTSACTPSQTLCGLDGGTPFCADTLSDNTNCGTCGNKCSGSKPVCQGGTCSTGACNQNALVLGDGVSGSNSAYQTLLQGVGFTVNLQASGTTTYTGTPAASGFGVIIVTPGNTYGSDMPSAGQTAIANQLAASPSTGVIFTEWAAYEVMNSRYASLASLLCYSRSSGNDSTLTFSSVTSHPIWNGLPSTFTTTVAVGSNVSGTLSGSCTEIASCTQCGTYGVAVRDQPSVGRVVQIAHAAGYLSAAWYNDTNLTTMMANAALWAARCE